MTKNNFYKYLAIALVLVNILLLVFFFTNRPGHGPMHGPGQGEFKGPKDIIIERLGFDAQQQKEYDDLITTHQKTIKSLRDEISTLKQALYQSLNDSQVNQSLVDSLINQISAVQNKIELTHYWHFVDIKKLCREEQLGKFEALTNDIAQLFSEKRPPRKDE